MPQAFKTARTYLTVLFYELFQRMLRFFRSNLILEWFQLPETKVTGRLQNGVHLSGTRLGGTSSQCNTIWLWRAFSKFPADDGRLVWADGRV
jgi:hypothetical protein